MIIRYTKSDYVREENSIDIKDTKNVFLKGKNPYDGLDTYFGIWENNNTLVIVNIISYRTIGYKRYLNTNLHTECDIRKYLEDNKSVISISRKEFKKQLDHIKEIFEI